MWAYGRVSRAFTMPPPATSCAAPPDPFEIYESAAARIKCTEQEPGAGEAQTQIRTWTTTDGRTGGRTDVDGREALWH